MPRVYLTEKQRKEAAERDAVKRMYKLISDAFIIYKSRNDLKQVELAEEFSVHHTTISKMLKMQPVSMEINKWLKLLYVLGLEIKPRNQA